MSARELLTDDVMCEALMVLPPPPDFAAYLDEVRARLVAVLDGPVPRGNAPADRHLRGDHAGRYDARCGHCKTWLEDNGVKAHR